MSLELYLSSIIYKNIIELYYVLNLCLLSIDSVFSACHVYLEFLLAPCYCFIFVLVGWFQFLYLVIIKLRYSVLSLIQSIGDIFHRDFYLTNWFFSSFPSCHMVCLQYSSLYNSSLMTCITFLVSFSSLVLKQALIFFFYFIEHPYNYYGHSFEFFNWHFI